MPGFDKSRFIGLRKSDEELECGICLAILNKPLVTPCCGQTYCGECLREWLKTHDTCPNDRKNMNVKNLLQPQRLVKNLLDKLEIKCDFFDSGCDTIVNLGRLNTHVKTCRYNPIAICDVCNEKNGDKDRHDCNNNFLVKIKSLESYNKEINNKYDALNKEHDDTIKNVRHVIDELNDCRASVEEIKGQNIKLSEINKRLKSDKIKMNKRLKTINKFSENSIKQLDDSIKLSIDLKTKFFKLQQIYKLDTYNECDFDSVNNLSSFQTRKIVNYRDLDAPNDDEND